MQDAVSDAQFVERIREGDTGAFGQVVEEHQQVIYGFLRARLMQQTDAEDLAQEVFIRFYQNREKFDPEQPLRPWLLGIARNILREHVRKLTRRKEVAWATMCLDIDEGCEDPDGPYDDAVKHLPGCVESLGPSAREAVALRYRSNWRLKKIGEKLKRSEGAIKLLIFRARQALRGCLMGKLKRDGTPASECE